MKGLASIAGPKIRVNSVSPGLLLTVCLLGHHGLVYLIIWFSLRGCRADIDMFAQDWGKQFSQERLDAALAKTKLKKFATVEVSLFLMIPD